jgi:hypothetical protein
MATPNTETQNLIEALKEVTAVMKDCLKTVAPGASAAGSAGSASVASGSASVASSAGPSPSAGSSSSQPNKKITLALKLEQPTSSSASPAPATTHKVTECRVVKDTPTTLAEIHDQQLWIKYVLEYSFNSGKYEVNNTQTPTTNIVIENQTQLILQTNSASGKSSPPLPKGTFDIDVDILNNITTLVTNDPLFPEITLEHTLDPTNKFKFFKKGLFPIIKKTYIEITPDILVSKTEIKYVLSLEDELKGALPIKNSKSQTNFSVILEADIKKINDALPIVEKTIKGGKKSRQTRKGGKKRRRNTKRR